MNSHITKLMNLILVVFFMTTSALANGILANNKQVSAHVLSTSYNKPPSDKSGGDWNTEKNSTQAFLIKSQQILAEWLNLIIETNECGSPTAAQKLDQFFSDKQLNADLVSLLNEHTKQCLSAYLSTK